jgi:hypothetical protein
MQDAFWTIGAPLLFLFVGGSMLLGPWLSTIWVRKERSKKYKLRKNVV